MTLLSPTVRLTASPSSGSTEPSPNSNGSELTSRTSPPTREKSAKWGSMRTHAKKLARQTGDGEIEQARHHEPSGTGDRSGGSSRNHPGTKL